METSWIPCGMYVASSSSHGFFNKSLVNIVSYTNVAFIMVQIDFDTPQ